MKALLWGVIGLAVLGGAAYLLISFDRVDPIDPFPTLMGPYLGQTLPGRTPRRFAPGILGADLHSPPVFSPGGDVVYWRMMADEGHDDILQMKQADGIWGQPSVVSFASRFFGSDAPFLSSDGQRLYYTSFRSTSLGDLVQQRESIWFVEATARGWSSPRPFEGIVNDMDLHWEFTLSDDGTLYFASDGEIYVASHERGHYREPVPIGPPISTPGRDEMPFVGSDGSYLIFTSDGHPGHLGNSDLYISLRQTDGTWGIPIHLDPPINTSFQEIYPVVSPDGACLFFLSTRHGAHGAYWVDFSQLKEFLSIE